MTITCRRCGKRATTTKLDPIAAVCKNTECPAYNSFWTIGTPGYHERFEEV